jgi:hypothetical protein
MSSCWTNQGLPKIRYNSRADAKTALRTFAAIGRDVADQHAYRCQSCSFFHIGHYPTSPAIRAAFRDRHRGAISFGQVLTAYINNEQTTAMHLFYSAPPDVAAECHQQIVVTAAQWWRKRQAELS